MAVPVASHWAIDAGYRFSRIDADTPVNTQGVTFGVGYRSNRYVARPRHAHGLPRPELFSRVPERAIGGGTMLIVERPVVEWIERVARSISRCRGVPHVDGRCDACGLVDATVCDAVVDALVAADFLRRRPNDTYVRRESRR